MSQQMPTNVHNSRFSQERISVQHSLGRYTNSLEFSNKIIDVNIKIVGHNFKRLISRSMSFIKCQKLKRIPTMWTIMGNPERISCSTVHVITKTLYNMLSGYRFINMILLNSKLLVQHNVGLRLMTPL